MTEMSLTINLDSLQINALHDVISRETRGYSKQPRETPERIRELRFIEEVLLRYIKRQVD